MIFQARQHYELKQMKDLEDQLSKINEENIPNASEQIYYAIKTLAFIANQKFDYAYAFLKVILEKINNPSKNWYLYILM